MSPVTLACPHCGYSKEMDQTLLPPQGTTVRCPKCGGHFPLQAAPAAPEPPSPAASPPEASLAQQPRQEPDPRIPSSALRSRTLALSFAGNAREYFGIWIVNTLLRVVTLGIYSPWAKVRKRRYFYGNALLDEASFDYLADPMAILKGWFIAALFFGVYSFASRTSPIASGVMGLLFAALYPWVAVRSRVFNLRNTSHRNIRFTFRPNYRDSYKVFLWWSLLVPVTLGILAPYVIYRQKRFLVENSAYGTTPFRFESAPREYYRIFAPLFILVPIMLAATATLWLYNGKAYVPPPSILPLVQLLPLLLFLLIYLVAGLYLPTAITNVTWSATSIGRHSFASKLRVRDLAWIHLSNAVAVVCTLGLLSPWAAVRLVRYRLEKLTLAGIGSLDSIVAGENQAMGATGEELGDMFGFDLGL